MGALAAALILWSIGILAGWLKPLRRVVGVSLFVSLIVVACTPTSETAEMVEAREAADVAWERVLEVTRQYDEEVTEANRIANEARYAAEAVIDEVWAGDSEREPDRASYEALFTEIRAWLAASREATAIEANWRQRWSITVQAAFDATRVMVEAYEQDG